ncbi:uncharacterized protein UTRI_06744 [Ustilago trichophora]|uniref:Uncharacterized protein n=1 Tax=Ustilago trichophora TaxID=86804 RepID=A0A5C3EQ70_9BASI|nr:uncharacterized protein UTRI_06744 [Ustilago trichophora]
MAPRKITKLPPPSSSSTRRPTRSTGFTNDAERRKVEKQVKTDLSELKKALNAIPTPKALAPKPLTLELVKEIAKMDAPKRTRKQSKLLVKQYTPKSDHYIGWEHAVHQGNLKLKQKLQDHSARVVATQLDLKDFFSKEYQLPKANVQPDTTGFQSVTFDGQEDTIHLVDKNGLHYASVIKKPDSPKFEEMYQEFRRLQADLPKSAGAPVESLRGDFFTFHLMLSGQDTACMDGPYFNLKFVKNYRTMIKFLRNKHVTALREYCNTRFFECFPSHASHYMDTGSSEHYRPHGAFLWAPCFPSLAINQEGQAYSLPHRDRRDYLQGLAGVFSYGDYTKLQISFTEAKVSLDFPPGALCFFPSHVLHHFNSPILPGETRGSMTMFMSSDVVKWNGLGGKVANTPEAQQAAYRQRCIDAWQLFQPLPDSD